jgi:hypothetical protein
MVKEVEIKMKKGWPVRDSPLQHTSFPEAAIGGVRV